MRVHVGLNPACIVVNRSLLPELSVDTSQNIVRLTIWTFSDNIQACGDCVCATDERMGPQSIFRTGGVKGEAIWVSAGQLSRT